MYRLNNLKDSLQQWQMPLNDILHRLWRNHSGLGAPLSLFSILPHA
jgi:hypothetical protein